MNKRKRKERKYSRILLKLPLLLFLPAARLLANWAIHNPATIENVYSRKIYPFISSPVSRFFGMFPFSVAEILLLTAAVVLPTAIIISLILAIKNKHGLYTAANWIVSLACTFSIMYFLFISGWALNYHRLPLAESLGYIVQPSSINELEDLCRDLIDRANEARSALPEKEDGSLAPPIDSTTVLKYARQAYWMLGQQHPVFKTVYGVPKPVLLSESMCYTETTGIFMPFTYEANLNVATPGIMFPATVCHEIAHQYGFSREDEANYLGYLASVNSGNDYFEYSGLMLALTYSMNALHSENPELYSELHSLYNQGLNSDIIARRNFWKKYEGPVAEKSAQVNNSYLKSNNQTDGVKSYGRMVDLLLAERRSGSSGAD